MASAGMPKITEVASSCAMTRPPAALMAFAPFAPSLPMPVRTTPMLIATGKRCDSFHGDVDIRKIAVDAAGGGVELDAAGGQ